MTHIVFADIICERGEKGLMIQLFRTEEFSNGMVSVYKKFIQDNPEGEVCKPRLR